MQAVEMGNVAVVHIHFLIIFQPFLQVSFLTDLHGWESLQVHLKLRHIIRITIQQASGGDDISIKLSEQLHIHSGTHTNADGSHAVTRHIETVSGEEVGAVTSQPCEGSCTVVELKNRAAPFKTG